LAFIKKVSFLGFLVGAIVDIGGTNIGSLVLFIYIVFSYKLTHLPPAEINNQMMQILKNDVLMHSSLMVIGGFFSIFGGYIGALIAKHDELLNGALSSIFCVLGGIYGIMIGSYTGSIFLAVPFLLIDPLLGMLGGYLRLIQRSRKKQAFAPA
jgi:hypothetical protein